MLITPQLKDKLLTEFISTDKIQFQTSLKLLSGFLSVDNDTVVCLLNHFKDIGLCSVEYLLGGNLHIVLNAKAYDMQIRGGFVAREELYQKELLKLEKELENLSKDLPEKAGMFETALTAISIIKTCFL
ncbi:MAG: hypothetical protein K5685_00950 [Bacteroidales bacterium]|nr:hypothetical protein [Bacteroidales bacterium]